MTNIVLLLYNSRKSTL